MVLSTTTNFHKQKLNAPENRVLKHTFSILFATAYFEKNGM